MIQMKQRESTVRAAGSCSSAPPLALTWASSSRRGAALQWRVPPMFLQSVSLNSFELLPRAWHHMQRSCKCLDSKTKLGVPPCAGRQYHACMQASTAGANYTHAITPPVCCA